MNTHIKTLMAATCLALAMVACSGGGGGGNTDNTTPAGVKPTITAQPTEQTVTVGDTATFSVQATGTPAPGFQWRKNGQQLLGETKSTLSLTNVKLEDEGAVYDVIVHNDAGNVTSNPATLRVKNKPGFFTVRFVTTNAGTLNGSVIQSLAPGTNATPVTAVAGSGASFINWTGPNGFVSTANPLTVTNVQSDLTITANYAGGKVGCIAADVVGIDHTGAAAKLSDYKGSVIVLDVSAEWCGPCNADALPLENFYQKYKAQGLKVVTVLSQNNAGAIPAQSTLQSWVNKGLTFRVMNDTTGTTPRKGNAESVYVAITNGFPTFVVIDKNFVVQYIQGGYSATAVENKVKECLAK